MTISKNKKNYWKGRKRGPQTKEHIRKIMQTRQKNNSYICSKEQVKKIIETRRKNNSYVFSEKHKEKIRKGLTGHVVTATTRNKIRIGHIGKKHTLSSKQKIREWHIAHPNRKFSNTKIEQKTAAELERRDFIRNEDFFQNFGIAGIKNVDFYLPKLNIVIECDGCFYHACSEHGSPKHYQYAPANDAKNTALLKAAGYQIFRFWGHDITNSVEKCINQIQI